MLKYIGWELESPSRYKHKGQFFGELSSEHIEINALFQLVFYKDIIYHLALLEEWEKGELRLRLCEVDRFSGWIFYIAKPI